MTKSLTELLKEGKLAVGCYYMTTKRDKRVDAYENFMGVRGYDTDYIAEVIAPVPSYDEWKKMDSGLKELACKNDSLAMECGKLQEQLKIATKALKEINKNYRFTVAQDVVYKALKEMKGVK